MGIRVKKCVGWGIKEDATQFLAKDASLWDIKIVRDKELIKKAIESEEFLELCDEINGNRRNFFADSIFHFWDDNIGLCNYSIPAMDGMEEEDSAIIFYPYKKFYRNDDIIDYLEVDCDTFEVKYLDRSGIYPFDGMWICERDCISGKKGKKINGGDYNMFLGLGGYPTLLKNEDMIESYKTDWRITIPERIILGVYLSPLINDKTGLLKSLKVIKATWWS